MARDMETEAKIAGNDSGQDGSPEANITDEDCEFIVGRPEKLKRGMKSRHIQFLALGMTPRAPNLRVTFAQ